MYVKVFAVATALVVGLSPQHPTQSKQSTLQRTDLLKSSLSVTDREVVQVRVDFESGASSIRHRHPGEEIAYVLEGTIEYQLGAQAAVIVRKGESLFIPDGMVHIARNIGQGPASELATYVVRKDAALLEPAH